MKTFVRIVESGRVSAASASDGLAKSAVSRRLAELEERLSTRLIRRTTRRSSLTDAGARYYERAKQILSEIENLESETRGVSTSPTGVIRLSAPLSFGLAHMVPIIEQFVRDYPAIDMKMDLGDRHVDLIEEGFDVAIRIGHLTDSSLHARKITRIRHVLVASPGYLRQRGTPDAIEDLEDHDFILFRDQSIEYLLPDGSSRKCSVKPHITANNGDFVRELIVRGLGLTWLPTFMVSDHIRSGALQLVLPQVRYPEMHVYAIYPTKHFLTRASQLFIEYVAARLPSDPPWDEGLA